MLMRKNHHLTLPFAIANQHGSRAERLTLLSTHAGKRLQEHFVPRHDRAISIGMDKQVLLHAIPDLLFSISRQGFYLQCQAAADYDLLVSPDQFLGKVYVAAVGLPR
jgi:hypothetical protein